MLGKRTKILTITLLTLLSTATFAAVHTQYSATVCSNQPYLFGCDPYTTGGPKSNTLGDSTVTVNLTFGSPKATAYTATIEPNQIYLFGCKQMTTDGEVWSNTLQQLGCECDSTVTVTLKVQAPAPTEVKVGYNAEIEVNQIYLLGCKTYQFAAAGQQTLQDTIHLAGKDSITIVSLNVVDPTPVEVKVGYNTEIEVNQIYLLGCKTYQFAAAGQQTLQDTIHLAGKDSITIVSLNVVDPTPVEVKVGYSTEIKTDEIYLFGCKTYQYSEPGPRTLQDTIHLAGKDSITIVSLTVAASGGADPITVAYSTSIKQGETYLFGCDKLTKAGEYRDTLKRYEGSDSIIVLKLKVNADTAVAYTAKIKQGQTYLFGCQQLTDAGPYTNTLTRALGGDSIINLTLKVLMPTYCDTTIVTCDSLEWIHGTLKVSGDYFDTIPNVAGGDSIVTLHLTINHSYDTIVPAVKACDSYNWVDAAYSFDTLITKTGTYVHTFVLSTGCDSVVTLPVTINHSYDTIVPAITECDSLRWTDVAFSFDTLITKSGTYVHTFVLPTGCDSVVTLPVTINYSAASEETPITECNSYYWKNADTTITKTGIYTHVFKTVSQCDSVVTLNATIYYSDTTVKPTPTEPVCNRYYWAEADTMITKSGTYTHVFQNQHGCDSVVNFTVTITIPYVDTLEVRAYYGYRIIMINRNQIENLDGWHLDSLQNDHPEYVKWHQIDLNGNDTKVGEGYYYTLANGEPLPTGYKYYAIVEIPAVPGKSCGALGRTETITIGVTAAAPALVPSLARPGEDIQVINLNPEVETTIRVYSTDGILQKVLTSIGETHCTIKASDAIGFYLVEIVGDDMKSTLRYMVK